MMEAPDFPSVRSTQVIPSLNLTMTLELAGNSDRVVGQLLKLTFKPLHSRRSHAAPKPRYHCGARACLGWQPKIPLREGLARTIEHFRRELGLVRD